MRNTFKLGWMLGVTLMSHSQAFAQVRFVEPTDPAFRDVEESPSIKLNEANCISAGMDADGDGYARVGASLDAYVRYDSALIECPAPYIKSDHANDCDDSNAAIHPHAIEVAADGIDQDCDGLADDPHFKYETDLSRVTKSSITFTLVNKQPPTKKGLYHYEIEYFPLKNSAQVTLTPKAQLPEPRGVQDKLHDITLSGLEPATVYALRVKLYRLQSGVLNYVTQSGDLFYGTTNGGRAGGLEEVRTRILLNGFKELGDSQLGRIGYMGSESRDGIRYGASTAEQWCTEFYAYVTNSWLGFSSGGLDYSGAVISAFKADNSWYAAYSDPAATQDNVPEYVRTNARRGDYLAEDSNGDGDINSNHSALFLAWDESAGKFWSLDGNSDGRGGNGNYVGVKQNTFSYPNSADNAGSTAYRAVGVGKLTCRMVGADCSSGK